MKLFSYIRDRHSEIYKALLFVLVIAVIVYIYPKEGKFRYEFENLKGKPWNYEDLIAPFDFSIRKSAEEMEAETAEVRRSARPYFRVDKNAAAERKKAFVALAGPRLESSLGKTAADRHLQAGKRLLDSVYARGVLELSDAVEGKSVDFTLFLIDESNIAEEKELGSFYTMQTAHDLIRRKLESEKNLVADSLLPLLEEAVIHSVHYDEALTEKELQQSLNNISPSRSVIMQDQRIISRGEIVDGNKYQVLVSLKAAYEQQSGGSASNFFITIGQVVIVGLCLLILVFFLGLFRNDVFLDNNKMAFILLLILLMVLMASLTLSYPGLNIYVLPFCILPVIIRAFYDTRIALFVHLVTVLIISLIAPDRFSFVFIQLVAGIVSIFSIVNMRRRSQIFTSALIVFLAYSASYFGLMVIQEGKMDSIGWQSFIWFGISAGLTIFSYPLIFVFEKLFGFISDVSLMELSDTNSPLLRELSAKAPGTFQHSLQVANLAEEVIFKIGGNALLVRTGALYHDIGKMDMPVFFIENQATTVNPHEEIGFEESAAIIISHVIKGIEKARKHKLPEQLIDFIRTHHGTTVTGYFYRSYQKSHPDEVVDEGKFRYPGPIPFSRETAVLMMADSVEAASRSLKSYDSDSIDALIERIINSQVEQNQFINADITFKDITSIKKILKKKLMNIYHVRVEYPR